MKYLIITGNPKTEGLCHSVTEAVRQGAVAGGAEVAVLTLADIKRCRVCGDGWGICRPEHRCVIEDDAFAGLQEAVRGADALCLVTPVYFSEMAEGMKSFLDRLRRCEARPEGAVAGKPVLVIASPGGSGHGALPCLEQMNRFCGHMRTEVFDHLVVNRWNNDYTRAAAYSAAKAMAEGRKVGQTVVYDAGGDI